MFKTNGEKALLAICLITTIFIGIAAIGGLGKDETASEAPVQSAVLWYFERMPDDLYSINASELKTLLEQEKDIYVLDIRKEGYFVRGNIPGSVNIPFEDVGKSLEKLPKDKRIIVYCYNGQYSGQVVALLNVSGYYAKSLYGGWDSWIKETAKYAGEILQKFSNYNMRIAIIGDFSQYKSKSLHDFIYECNNGNSVFFRGSVEEGLAAFGVTF